MFTAPTTLLTKRPLKIELVQAVVGVSDGTTVNVNLNAIPQDGDFLHWMMMSGSTFGSSISTPAGFTDYTFGGTQGTLDGDATFFRLQPFGRLASSEASTSYSISRSTSQDAGAAIFSVWRGTEEDDGSPTGWGLSGTSTSATLNYSTVQNQVNPKDMILIFMMVNNGGAGAVDITTPPANFIEAASFNWNSTGSQGGPGTFDRHMNLYYGQRDALGNPSAFSPQIVYDTSVEGLTHNVRLELTA